MTTLLWCLLAAAAGSIAALLALLVRVQRALDMLHERMSGPPLVLPTTGARPCLVIEILNPLEVAAQDTPIAGPAGRFVPRLIEGIVYRRAAGMIAAQLRGHGVEAQVRHVG